MFNQETQFTPILGLLNDQLNASTTEGEASAKGPGISGNHHPQLIEILAEALSVKEEQIQDFEL
jgi:aspartyl aminopeptidase